MLTLSKQYDFNNPPTVGKAYIVRRTDNLDAIVLWPKPSPGAGWKRYLCGQPCLVIELLMDQGAGILWARVALSDGTFLWLALAEPGPSEPHTFLEEP